MSRDYAKKSGSARKKTPARKKPAARGKTNTAPARNVWRWYFAGLVSGIFRLLCDVIWTCRKIILKIGEK